MKANVAVQKKFLTYRYNLWKSQKKYDPKVITQQRRKFEKICNQVQTE